MTTAQPELTSPFQQAFDPELALRESRDNARERLNHATRALRRAADADACTLSELRILVQNWRGAELDFFNRTRSLREHQNGA